MSERISETITFHFDNVEQQKRFHERLEGWSGLTPSKHGFSAALRAQVSPDAESCYCPNCNILPPERERFRAQVIEECAKVAEERAASALALMNGAKRAGDLDDATQHLLVWTEAAAIASVIRSLSDVSAIAQERDVGEPVAYRARRIAEPDHWFFLTLAGVQALGEGMEVQPLYLHPTTSPSAISEAPTSAEAVKTSPEVGEMVAKLGGYDVLTNAPYWLSQAASLLIALDAERGRLREALKPLLKYKPTRIDYCPGESGEQAYSEAVEVFDRASSALPASDEGTTNE